MVTDFQRRVYAACSKIPLGRVATYKVLARMVGCKGYRAIGAALNRNPFAPKVPCHRVVSSDGALGGFAFGTSAKVRLLEQEGIRVCGGRIVDFEQVLWTSDEARV